MIVSYYRLTYRFTAIAGRIQIDGITGRWHQTILRPSTLRVCVAYVMGMIQTMKGNPNGN